MTPENTILPIAKRGEIILQQRAEPVDNIHAPEIQKLIDDMISTVRTVNGVGLAAPQVFISKRIIVVASRPNARYPYAPLMQPTAMLNPEILWQSAESAKDWEGCLSVPGLRSPVPRPRRIRLRYLDREGTSIEAGFEGFVARIILHEYDHLEGKLFLGRVENEEEIVSETEFQKLVAARHSLI